MGAVMRAAAFEVVAKDDAPWHAFAVGARVWGCGIRGSYIDCRGPDGTSGQLILQGLAPSQLRPLNLAARHMLAALAAALVQP